MKLEISYNVTVSINFLSVNSIEQACSHEEVAEILKESGPRRSGIKWLKKNR